MIFFFLFLYRRNNVLNSAAFLAKLLKKIITYNMRIYESQTQFFVIVTYFY